MRKRKIILFDEALQFNGKHQAQTLVVLGVLVLRLPGPVLLKLPKLEALAVPVLALRLPGPVLKLPEAVPVLGLGVDVGLVVDGSAAAVVSPLAVTVGLLSGAPVLVITVNAGIVAIGFGIPVTFKQSPLIPKKENA